MQITPLEEYKMRSPYIPLSGPTKDTLAQWVRRFLNQRIPDCNELSVEDRGCTVILRGHVPSSDIKRRCLQCSQRVAGGIHVIDELDVTKPKWRTRPR